MVAVPIHPAGHLHLQPPAMHVQPMLAGLPAPLATLRTFVTQPAIRQPQQRKVIEHTESTSNVFDTLLSYYYLFVMFMLVGQSEVISFNYC